MHGAAGAYTVSAVTGIVEEVDTAGTTRRETAIHPAPQGDKSEAEARSARKREIYTHVLRLHWQMPCLHF